MKINIEFTLPCEEKEYYKHFNCRHLIEIINILLCEHRERKEAPWIPDIINEYLSNNNLDIEKLGIKE